MVDTLAISLYRDFSEDVYCAGFLNGVQTDEGLQKEFAEWLQEQDRQGVESFRDYELSSLPILREIVLSHLEHLIKRRLT